MSDIYLRSDTCIYIYIYIHMFIYIHICIYTHNICSCVFPYLFVCYTRQICLYMCIYIYVHMYTEGETERTREGQSYSLYSIECGHRNVSVV